MYFTEYRENMKHFITFNKYYNEIRDTYSNKNNCLL